MSITEGSIQDDRHRWPCWGPIHSDVPFRELGRGKRHWGIVTQCSVCHQLWEQEERAVRHISREDAEKYYDITGEIID